MYDTSIINRMQTAAQATGTIGDYQLHTFFSYMHLWVLHVYIKLAALLWLAQFRDGLWLNRLCVAGCRLHWKALCLSQSRIKTAGGPESSFSLRPPWAPAEIFSEGAKPSTPKKVHIFLQSSQQFFQKGGGVINMDWQKSSTSRCAEGANENVRIFFVVLDLI